VAEWRRRDEQGRFKPARRRDREGRFLPDRVRKKPAPRLAPKKPAPRPAPKKPAPRPVSKKPAPRPAFKKPASRLAPKKPAPRPASKKPAPRPAFKKLAPRPVPKKLAPRPVLKKPAPRLVPKKLVPKKLVFKKSAPRPAPKKPAPRPTPRLVSKKPAPRPTPRPVPKKPAPRPVPKKPVPKKPVLKKPAPRPVPKKPAPRPVPKKPVRKKPVRKKPTRRPERPRVPEGSALAEAEVQAKLVELRGLLDLLQPGLDTAVQSMINFDGTVDGELRVGDLPPEWREVEGVPLLVATLSSAFRSWRPFAAMPAHGGAYWVSFGVRFGPQNEAEIGELAELYKRFRGLFQIGTYPAPAWNTGPIQIVLTSDRAGLRSMVQTLLEKRGLPPTNILVRFVWTTDRQRPGHYRGEK
jgi:hypothetical protein